MKLARSWLVSLRQSISGLALFALCLTASHSSTVNWGIPLFSAKVTSTSVPLDDSFVFELGAFTNGFTPTSANKSNWAANWHPVNRSFYDVTTSTSSGSHDMTSNAAPFQTTSKGYIWGHNCSKANGEWILVTDPTWTWPAANPGSPISEISTWSTLLGTEVIVGQLRGTGFHLKTAVSAGNSLPLIPATEWRTMRFTPAEIANTAIGGWQSDPDRDGMTNLLEYALGKNPRSKASVWTALPSVTTIGDFSYLHLNVPKCGYTSASLAVEVSSDLSVWYSISPHVVTMVNTADLLQVRSSTAIGSAGRQSIRLKASIP